MSAQIRLDELQNTKFGDLGPLRLDESAAATVNQLAAEFESRGTPKALQQMFPGIRADAASGQALARELQKLSQIPALQPLTGLTAFDSFPGVSDQPAPFQQQYTWQNLEYQKGAVSRSYDDPGGTANIAFSPNSVYISKYLANASYNLQDIGQAALKGMPIDAYKMQAAWRAIHEEADLDIWFGNADYNITGLYNTAGIVDTAVANWATGGAGGTALGNDQIEDQFTAFITRVMTALKMAQIGGALGALAPNRCALPVSAYTYLAVERRSMNSDMSLLQYLELKFKAFAPDFKFTQHPELEGNVRTGSTISGDRWAAMYRADPMVVGRVVALPPQWGPPDVEMFRTSIGCHTQMGGLAVRYPVAIQFIHGF